MKKDVWVILLLIMLLYAGLVMAGTKIVDNGNSGCDNTTGLPYCTIQAAIDAATSGDTIQIEPGTYLENININKPLILQGSSATNTIIDGNHLASTIIITNNATVTIRDLQIINGLFTNYWYGNGGGIRAARGSFHLYNCIIRSNDAYSAGGVLNPPGGTSTIDNCAIEYNTSGTWGGGGVKNWGDLVIVNSTISQNHCDQDGGGIYLQQKSLTLINCTISSNTSDSFAGGIHIHEGSIYLTNCTVVFNEGSSVGGIFCGLTPHFTFLRNTIVAHNRGSLGPDLYGSFESRDYNLIGDTSETAAFGTETHNLYNVDPLLGPLAFNGGSTKTHALLPNSPAIDAGGEGLATDQRGFMRPIDTDSPNADNGNDIGAYEYTTFDCRLTKSYTPNPPLGANPLIYTLCITNVGPFPAPDVVVTDALPSGLIFLSATGTTGTITNTGNLVVWTVGSLTAGASEEATIHTDAHCGGTITNTAILTSSDLDYYLANNTSSVKTILSGADLVIKISDTPDPTNINSHVTYTLIVTNVGPESASGITVSNTLPNNATLISCVPSQGTWTENAGVVSCQIGILNRGETASITLVESFPVPALVTNIAVVTGGITVDPQEENNIATEKTLIGPVDLGLSMTVDPVLVPYRSNLVYSIILSNNGSYQTTSAVVKTILPEQVTFLQATPSHGTVFYTNGTVTWSEGELSSGDTANLSILCFGKQYGPLFCTSSVSCQEIDLSSDNNSFVQTNSIEAFWDIAFPFMSVQTSYTMEWGDYDGDGDMDFYYGGLSSLPAAEWVSTIFRNDGDGVFVDIGLTNTPVFDGYAAWGDPDGDGDLDVLVCGEDRGIRHVFAILYRNNGADTFVPWQTLMDVDFSERPGYHSYPTTCAWGDYDNDGDMDIIIGMYDATFNPIIKFFRNEDGILSDSGRTFDMFTIQNGSISCCDYNSDGKLDFIMVGHDKVGNYYPADTRVYRNKGLGNFEKMAFSLQRVRNGQAQWGDYDNDGDMDLVLAGEDENYLLHANIYEHIGNTFSNVGENCLQPTYNSCLDWGDFDADGDLDILYAGTVGITTTPFRICDIWRNDGSNIFTRIFATLADSDPKSVHWVDYDNDGDLDIAFAGSGEGWVRIYRNQLNPSNTIPTPPTELSTEYNGMDIAFKWNAGSDGATCTTGLTYNLWVGTSPRSAKVCPPMALSNGTRCIPAMGNAGNLTIKHIVAVIETTYYWSVQTINHAMNGSPFTPEQCTCIGQGCTQDTDADQIPDYWEYKWSGNPTNLAADADDDHDTQNTLSEYLADTDPFNENSCFKFLTSTISNALIITAQSSTSRVYSLERSTNLLKHSWQSIEGQTDLNGGMDGQINLIDTGVLDHAIYRIHAHIP